VITVERYFLDLTAGLYDDEPQTSVAQVPAYTLPAGERLVYLRTLRLQDERTFDFSSPDYYAVIAIDGQEFIEVTHIFSSFTIMRVYRQCKRIVQILFCLTGQR